MLLTTERIFKFFYTKMYGVLKFGSCIQGKDFNSGVCFVTVLDDNERRMAID